MAKPLFVITPGDMDWHLDRARTTGDNVWFHGPPGIGKSSVIRAFAEAEAAKMGMGFYFASAEKMTTDWQNTFGYLEGRTAQWDALDVKGAPWINDQEKVTEFMANSMLPRAETHGIVGVLNLDDYAQAPTSVSNALTELVETGRIGTSYKLPAGWQIVATGNRKSDSSAVNKVGAQVYNRFSHFEVESDADSLSQYLAAHGSDGRLGAFLRARPELVHSQEKGDIAFSSGRTLEKVDRDIREIDDPARLEACIASHVSAGIAAEIMGYLSYFTQLTSFSKIVADPENAKVPDAGDKLVKSAQFAIVGMCASKRLNEDNIDAVATYIMRLPEDMVTVFMLDVLATQPDLQETMAFSTLRAKMGSNAV